MHEAMEDCVGFRASEAHALLQTTAPAPDDIAPADPSHGTGDANPPASVGGSEADDGGGGHSVGPALSTGLDDDTTSDLLQDGGAGDAPCSDSVHEAVGPHTEGAGNAPNVDAGTAHDDIGPRSGAGDSDAATDVGVGLRGTVGALESASVRSGEDAALPSVRDGDVPNGSPSDPTDELPSMRLPLASSRRSFPALGAAVSVWQLFRPLLRLPTAQVKSHVASLSLLMVAAGIQV